jgi:hypothetical protein
MPSRYLGGFLVYAGMGATAVILGLSTGGGVSIPDLDVRRLDDRLTRELQTRDVTRLPTVSAAAANASTEAQSASGGPASPAPSTGAGVRVHHLEIHSEPPVTYMRPSPGHHYVSVDVEICAGDETFYTGPGDFQLQMADNSRYPGGLSRRPALVSGYLSPQDCLRGWITYEVAADTAVNALIYTVFELRTLRTLTATIPLR